MRTEYIINGYIAFSEQDSFKNGCYGPSQSEFTPPNECTLKEKTLKDLLKTLKAEFCGDDDSFLFDSCEEPGRIDLQVQQLKPFQCSKPSTKTLEKWKAGEIDLWLTCYSFRVSKVITEFSLTEELAKE